MDKNCIDRIVEISRPEESKIVEYGKYSLRQRDAIYDDKLGTYKIIKTNDEVIEVNSSKALIEYIKSELERREKTEGQNSSLKVGEFGATFIADDDFGEGKAVYTRQLSQQWNVLTSIDGKIMNHEEFLMTLLKLSPSINDFKNTYTSFLKVRVVGTSELVSNPVFVNNQAESGYLVKYKLEGGQGADSVIPDSLKITVPYIKASKTKYEIDVDVQILNNGNNELRIKINIPLMENIEEQAIIDEITSIKEELKDYTKLLILSDI